ncbi:MAG: Ldh family oxidoreductase [candidate division KSB1 bacterium]|nr:Ldh family oxidoreductase [candidate division KSB1 bacterium]
MQAHIKISLTDLKQYEYDVFKGMGVPPEDADICADVLNAADLRGIDSHGIGRLKPIYYDRVIKYKIQNAETNFETVRDTAAVAVIDGHNGMGMVIAKKCMDIAIEKAGTYGIGMVIAKNSTHYGIAAYYPMMACEHNMIGITGTNARPSVAPTFGVQNLLGTNPLVFGMPSDEAFPFVNDHATSMCQRGKIEQYAREGKELVSGWVVDRNGEPVLDADQALEALSAGKAALTPLGGITEETGGHKGYGFATVVEILSTALQQGQFLNQLSGLDTHGNRIPIRLGHFFIAVDIKAFTDIDAFKATTGDILRTLRTSQKAKHADRIYTHGEKEYRHSTERIKSGVPLPTLVQQQMVTMRNELGLACKFEWE